MRGAFSNYVRVVSERVDVMNIESKANFAGCIRSNQTILFCVQQLVGSVSDTDVCFGSQLPCSRQVVDFIPVI